MNALLRFRSVIAAFSQALVDELTQLVLRLNTWAAVEHQPDGTHGAISVTALTYRGDTQTTVGGAGGATGLPSSPLGYLTVTIDGTDVVVPYYKRG